MRFADQRVLLLSTPRSVDVLREGHHLVIGSLWSEGWEVKGKGRAPVRSFRERFRFDQKWKKGARDLKETRTNISKVETKIDLFFQN